jgi:hypothetical protein
MKVLEAAGALVFLLGIVTLVETVVIGLLMAALGVFAVWYSRREESGGDYRQTLARSVTCRTCGAKYQVAGLDKAPGLCHVCGGVLAS